MKNELEINVVINEVDGKFVVSSRDIAVGLGKEHSDVTRKIREVLDVGEFSEIDFIDENNRKYKECLLDKNAFILLVMNYSGFNDFKRVYIKRFDEMEKYILSTNNKSQLLLSIYNGGQEGIIAAKQLTEIEVVEAVKPLQLEIKNNKNEIKLLASENLQWADRPFINAVVRKFSGSVCNCNFGEAWTKYKKELLYKHSINLNSRITMYFNTHGKKPKTLDMLHDIEIPNAVSTAVSLCKEFDVDISELIKNVSN